MPFPLPLPSFIHVLEQHWPFISPLAGCKLVSARFDPASSSEQDMRRYGLQPTGNSRKRQSEFLAGRICAARALSSSQLPGRDAVSGQPLWPKGWCGSITHSHGQAVAIVASTLDWKSLGLDIERRIEAGRALRLRSTLLTAHEQEWLEGLDQQTAANRLGLIFSAKESLYKALNPLTGVYFGFQDAQVTEYDETGKLSLQLLRDLSDEYRYGMEFPCLWTPFAHGVLTLAYLAA